MNKILLVTGPSGIGKTFLGQQLLDKYPDQFKLAQLFTTRPPRSGQQDNDRISLQVDEFKKKSAAGEFFIDDKFHNNFYGYPKALFNPGRKHLIVNTWPALVPKFTSLPNVYVVALVSPLEQLSNLEARMLARGDDPAKVAERLPLIKKDQAALMELKPLILSRGQVFLVENDQTIRDKVLPWIESQFEL